MIFQKDGISYDLFISQVKKRYTELKIGKWEFAIRKPQRTPLQNRSIHKWFTWLSSELNGLGVELKFGNYASSFTENTAKEFFITIYLAGKRTSKTSTAELSNAVEKCIGDINLAGGQLAFPSKEMENLGKSLR